MHIKTSDQEKLFFGIVYSYNCVVNTCGLYESDLNVLRVHLHVISRGVIIQNQYFIHLDKWLAENAPQFLNKIN